MFALCYFLRFIMFWHYHFSLSEWVYTKHSAWAEPYSNTFHFLNIFNTFNVFVLIPVSIFLIFVRKMRIYGLIGILLCAMIFYEDTIRQENGDMFNGF